MDHYGAVYRNKPNVILLDYGLQKFLLDFVPFFFFFLIGDFCSSFRLKYDVHEVLGLCYTSNQQ